MFRSALLMVTLLALAALAPAQNVPDTHYAAPRTSAIARKSAFIHGYLHGYEQGFHLADVDIQMGRGVRDLGKCKEAHQAIGYRHEFGKKRYFESGYREGARVGYADGIAGRAFRAVRELQDVRGVKEAPADAGPDLTFDKGFSAGYGSGQQQGLQDGRRAASYNPPLASCPTFPAKAGDPRTFCTAYLDGYRVGYSDGFTNVARRAQAEIRAEK